MSLDHSAPFLEAVLALFSLPFVMSASPLPRDLPPRPLLRAGAFDDELPFLPVRGVAAGRASRAIRAGMRARERPGVRVECCICARGAPEDARPLPFPARLLGAARAAVFSSCAISAGPRAHMSQRRLWFWFERDRVF